MENLKQLTRRMLLSTFLVLFFFMVGCGSRDEDAARPIEEVPVGEEESPFVCFSGLSPDIPVCFFSIIENSFLSPEESYYYLNPKEEVDFPSFFNPVAYRRPIRFLDLKDILPGTYVSPNFRMEEILSIEKGRYGIFSPKVLDYIQVMRDVLGILHVTSAYRSPAYNAQVGGVRWSRHQYGDAIDLVSGESSSEELAKACIDMEASFYQVYTDHVHCDWREKPLHSVFFGEDFEAFFVKNGETFLDHLHFHLKQSENIGFYKEAGGLRFFVEMMQEDPGTLVYDWYIEGPQGIICRSQEQTPFCESASGLYKIHVEVGKSIKLYQEIEIL